MRYFIAISFLLIVVACQKPKRPTKEWAIVLHGGAGNMDSTKFSAEDIQLYEDGLRAALDIGKKALVDGHLAIDVVEKVVKNLEDNPLFNAGKGAVFTNDGRNELDAAIMDGRDLNAGAVAGVGDVRNPISAARLVMEQSPHVLLIGKGASLFASEQGVEMVDSSYFYTEKRWQLLQRSLQKAGKNGTVGCVVLDRNGNLAAATSTGGMNNKRYGRVGDVPVIGAGTYANNNTCAVSATGHGEYFIRYTVAHDISALIEYKGLTLDEAAQAVVNGKLTNEAGSGGIIAVDKYGNITLEMNSTGMFRGWADASGNEGVAIFK
ncbi:isoaspartyl peptidase/L-asparaginase [Carboxylicivirga mesophila]|uniref:Isoaspartyl peptidase/L-asparaginase n=1 Tax=Carboxylicivirga mesophila TaxID=1166478 RepID=A0ABS5K6H3_9BACT|nr:isoaspartyl peptidase/L-asparaginase [Carboxylicivirga mesophila]MBS2210574.1 isoaspartyl peptidase/L-asparaginase [Carboxylicivirga mesophila]